MQPSSKPARYLPRARFTLRFLLILITLFMLWGGYHTNRARREQAALQLLRDGGASFSQDPVSEKTTWTRVTRPYNQLVRFLWGEPRITGLTLFHAPTAAELDAIGDLPYLDDLTFQRYAPPREDRVRLIHSVAASDIAPLPPGILPRILADHDLKGLSLALWELSTDDCRAIAAERNVFGITLYGCTLPEEGLAEIVQLPKLRRLWLQHCPITGQQLGATPGSPSLDTVSLIGTPVSPTFAAFLARSPNLTGLSCHHPTLTDDFLTSLTPHPRLETLHILRSQITPASFPALQQLPALKHLEISSNLTVEELIQLEKLLPGVRVQ